MIGILIFFFLKKKRKGLLFRQNSDVCREREFKPSRRLQRLWGDCKEMHKLVSRDIDSAKCLQLLEQF